MVQKSLKIRPPCHILSDYFLTRQIFERWPGCKNVKHNVPGGCDFSVFQHDNYQVSLIIIE